MPPKSFPDSKRLLGEVSKIVLTCWPGRARVRSSPELQRQEYRWGKWWGYSRRSRRASLGKRDSLRASPCSGVAGTPGRPSKTCCKNTCPKTSSGIYRAPLMITSADISTGGVHVFKSRYLGDLGEPYERDGDVLLREAILASCAAPTYFDPKVVGPYLLTDGGLWANNPSIIALTEAISKFKKGVEEVRIFSIGTGHTTTMYTKRGSWGLLTGWGGNKLVSYTLGLQSQASTNMAKLILGDRYLRLDPEIDSWELDDTRHLANLKALAERDFTYQIQTDPWTT